MYSEPSRTSTTDLFCKNSHRLKVVTIFVKKAPSQMFDWALNTPLYLIRLTYQKRASAARRSSLDKHIKNIKKTTNKSNTNKNNKKTHLTDIGLTDLIGTGKCCHSKIFLIVCFFFQFCIFVFLCTFFIDLFLYAYVRVIS